MADSMGKAEGHEKNRHGGGFASGLFWGIILGVFGMFMFATKRGKKLREYFREHGQGILQELEEIYAELEEKDVTKRLPESTKKDQFKEAKKEKDLSHIQRLQEHGRNVVRHFTRSGKPLK